VDATANLLALVILASVQSAKNVLATAASVLIANVMEKPNLDAAKRKRLHAVKKRKNPAAARKIEVMELLITDFQNAMMNEAFEAETRIHLLPNSFSLYLLVFFLLAS